MWKKVWIANGTGTYETALFDTGADVSLVDYKIAVEQLKLRFTGRSIKLTGVSGQPFRAFEFEATIFIPEAKIWRKQTVYVPEIPIQVGGRVIIGRDFMQATKLGLQYENNGKVWSPQGGVGGMTNNPPSGSRTLAGAIGGALLGWAVGGPTGAFIGLLFGSALGGSAEAQQAENSA